MLARARARSRYEDIGYRLEKLTLVRAFFDDLEGVRDGLLGGEQARLLLDERF